jgi:glycolate oxidase iron-sulfur subunit
MQTNFTSEQLKDPAVAHSEAILRKCVHCGFCTATCPTYLTLGDELDSPRGRIYLIKDMLENDKPADERVVKHIDRCLSCLACMTTCPSGVNYMHLVDHARAHIEKTYQRPWTDRMFRSLLAQILPYPGRFRAAMLAARLVIPFSALAGKITGSRRLMAMLALVPSSLPARQPNTDQPRIFKPLINKSARVAILCGCAQRVLSPSINQAAIELLTRNGVEVVQAAGEGCCGALVHHMGREQDALKQAKRNIDAWYREIENDGLDAIIITASGCGTTIKDYGHMLRLDAEYAAKAAKISELALDITEFLSTLGMPPITTGRGIRLAYHSACSMQHGQGITKQPRDLLKQAGFVLTEIPEGHICCGSAGTYNIMQPEIADMLKQRKIANIKKTKPDLIATGNIGCITQIGTGTSIPIAHTVEILNWAYGGKRPPQIPAGLGQMIEVD